MMQFVFTGINIIILIFIFIIPVGSVLYFIQFMKQREEKKNEKDELIGRIILLEKKVKELENGFDELSYINELKYNTIKEREE